MGLRVKKKVLTLLMSTTIAACGGGGSGGSSSNGTSESISLSTSYSEDLTLSESSSIAVPLSIEYSGTGQLVFTLTVNKDGIETNADDYESELSWEVTDNMLHISVNDIQNSGSTAFMLTASNGQKEESITIPIELENADVEALQEKANFYISSYESLVDSEETDTLKSSYSKVLDFLQIDYSDVVFTSSDITLDDALNSLIIALNNTSSSTYEDELSSAIEDFEEIVNEIANVDLSNVNKLADYSDSLTSLPDLKINYLGDGAVSFFIDNDLYGDVQDGVFVFYDEYAFIEKFVSTFLKQCEA